MSKSIPSSRYYSLSIEFWSNIPNANLLDIDGYCIEIDGEKLGKLHKGVRNI